MSEQVDERVVSMRFDSANFEKNIKQSTESLNKFNEGLKFDGALKGVGRLNGALSKVNVAPVSKAMELVHSKIKAIEVVGITTIANLTNSMVNSVKSFINQLTFAPIMSGFNEYELKINSIRTIMASTGESVAVVNQYLNELNEYSDRTIYSFSDMTQNIGKFTNAGVKLEDAVTAIKGISNEAAVSGANANEASRAMYNFAQALSAGSVKLIDWKSIEMANMATVEFKNELINTAVEVGTLTKKGNAFVTTTTNMNGSISDAFTSTKGFNESLNYQWMTTDVLIKTLSKYTDETTELGKKAYSAAQDVNTLTQMKDTLMESAQSGWAQTWEIIFGDIHDAKGFFTYLNDVIGKIVTNVNDSRNVFLSGAFESSWNDVSKIVSEANVDISDLSEKLIELAKSDGIPVDEYIEKYGGFKESLQAGWVNADLMSRALKSLSTNQKTNVKSTKAVTNALEEMEKVVHSVITGDFGNGQARYEALTKAGYDYAEVQGWVNEVLAGGKITIKEVSDAQLEQMGYTEDQIKVLRDLGDQAAETGTPLNQLIEDLGRPTGRSLLIDSIKEILEEVSKIMDTIKESYKEVFGEGLTSDDLYELIEKIHEFSAGLEVSDEALNNISRTMTGFFNGISLGLGLVSGSWNVLKRIWTIFKNLTGLNILGFTAKLGDAITQLKAYTNGNSEFMHTLVYMGNTTLDELYKVAGSYREFVEDFGMAALAQEKFPSILEAMSGLVHGLGTSFSGASNAVMDFISNIMDLKSRGELTFPSMAKTVSLMLSNIYNSFFNVPSLFEILSSSVGDFIQGIIDKVSIVNDSFGNFLQHIKDFVNVINTKLKEVGLPEIAAILVGGGTLFFMIKIGSILDKLTGSIVTFSNACKALVSSVSGAFSGLKTMFTDMGEAAKMRAKAEEIKAIAIAIGVLAGIIFVFSKMDQAELLKGIIALAGIATIIGVLAIVLGKAEKFSVDLTASSLALLALSSGILILVAALRLLAGIELKDVLNQLAILGLVMSALVAAVVVMSRFGGPSKVAGLFTMISISMAFGILAYSIAQMNKYTFDYDNIDRAITLTVMVMLAMAAASKIAGKTGAFAAVGLIAMAVSIGLFIKTLDGLAGHDYGEIIKNLGNIIMVFGLLGLLMLSLRASGKNVLKAGLAIGSISIAMLGLVMVMKLAGSLKAEEFENGIKAIAVFSLMMAAIIAVSHLSGQYSLRAGVMLGFVAGLLLIIMSCAVICGHIDTDKLKKGVAAVSILMILISGILWASGKANEAKTTMIAISIIIAELVLALYLLSNIDSKKVMTSAVAIGGVLFALSILMNSLKVLANTNKIPIGKLMTTFAGIAVIMGIAASIMYILSKSDSSNAITNAIALSILITFISSSMVICSKVGNISKNAIVGLGAMVLVASLCSGLLIIMSKFDMGNSIQNAISLTILLGALTGIMVVIGICAAPAAAAMTGVVYLGLFIGAVGLLLLALGAINTYIPEAKTFIDDGIPILESIGSGIGRFVGALVGGIASGTMDQIEDIGLSLSNFMSNMSVFISEVSALPDDFLNKVGQLSASMILITSAGFLNSIAGFGPMKDPIDVFSESLPKLGICLKAFGDSVKGLDNESISNAASAAEALANMSDSIPRTGGLISFFAGHKDLESFGMDLESFGKSLFKFGDSVDGLNVGAITLASSVGKPLVELADTIPNTGGLVSFFTGDNNIATFGSNLTSFGSSIKRYGDTVDGLNTEAISTSVTAATSLSELSAALPDAGGLLGFFTGNEDLKTFGSNLLNFGESIMSYSTLVTGIDKVKIDDSVNAASSLVSLSTTMASVDIVNFETFSDNVKLLGTCLSDFSAKNIDTLKIKSACDVAVKASDDIITISSKDYTGISGFVESLNSFGDITFSGFSDGFTSAISTIPVMFSELSSYVTTGINYTTSSNKSNFYKSAVTLMSGFSGGMESKKLEIDTAFSSIVSKLPVSAFNKKNSFIRIGKTLIGAFSSGIESKSESAKSAVSYVINETIHKIKGYYDKYITIGEYLVSGFCTGINNSTYKAKMSASAMANEAAKAAAKALEEHSPSKVGYKIGDYFGLGFVYGVLNNSEKSKKTGEDIANNAMAGLRRGVSDINSEVNGLNLIPSITPVFDMDMPNQSDLSLTTKVNYQILRGPIDSISTIVESAQDKIMASNAEVTNAINGLRDDFSDFYNSDAPEIGFYVDGRKLSKTIARDMDHQLSILARRGN